MSVLNNLKLTSSYLENLPENPYKTTISHFGHSFVSYHCDKHSKGHSVYNQQNLKRVPTWHPSESADFFFFEGEQ